MNQYQEYIQKYEAKVLNFSKELDKLSALRLFVFIFAIVIITILANERMMALVFLAVSVGAIVMGRIINRFNQVVYLKRHTAFLKEINALEVFRLTSVMDYH